jgi:glutamine amidotransferase
MIKILDYGMGNTKSILNMITKINGNAEACSKVSELENASAIILPGVGSFNNVMIKLSELGLIKSLHRKVILEKVPFLGICLGMQILFEKSEEGNLPGLGWIKGNVARFNFSDLKSHTNLKIPHMGWNIVNPKTYHNLFSGLEDEARFYFLHSYYVNCFEPSNIFATSNYGYQFTCAVRHDNIWGVQFHPEKSHRFGIQLFKNFLKEINNA